jgi:hypothetical protein
LVAVPDLPPAGLCSGSWCQVCEPPPPFNAVTPLSTHPQRKGSPLHAQRCHVLSRIQPGTVPASASLPRPPRWCSPPGARQTALALLDALLVPHPRLLVGSLACGDIAADRSRCRTLASGVQVSAPPGDHRTCTGLLVLCCSAKTPFQAIVTGKCHDFIITRRVTIA